MQKLDGWLSPSRAGWNHDLFDHGGGGTYKRSKRYISPYWEAWYGVGPKAWRVVEKLVWQFWSALVLKATGVRLTKQTSKCVLSSEIFN